MWLQQHTFDSKFLAFHTDVQREDLVRSLQMKLAETEKHHEKAKLTLSNAIRKIAQFENKIK